MTRRTIPLTLTIATLALLAATAQVGALTSSSSIVPSDDLGLPSNPEPPVAEPAPHPSPATLPASAPAPSPEPPELEPAAPAPPPAPEVQAGAEDVTKPNSRDPCGTQGAEVVLTGVGTADEVQDTLPVAPWDRTASRACHRKSLTRSPQIPTSGPVVTYTAGTEDTNHVAGAITNPVEPWAPQDPAARNQRPQGTRGPVATAPAPTVDTHAGALTGEGISTSRTWVLVASLPLLPVASHVMARLARREVLRNETRRAIMTHVRDAPGLTAAALARRLEVHYETARYHLDILAEVGLVTRDEQGARVRYFENRARVDQVTRMVAQALHTEGKRDILLTIARSGALPSGEVAERVDLAASTTSYHLRNLHEDGLLERRKAGRRVLYSVKPAVVPNLVELGTADPASS